MERVIVSSSAIKLKTQTTAWCAKAGASRGVSIVLLIFHDVDRLGVFKRHVEEEGGEPLLHDFDFQLGHLLDVNDLL